VVDRNVFQIVDNADAFLKAPGEAARRRLAPS
jgi:hypothetical protein